MTNYKCAHEHTHSCKLTAVTEAAVVLLVLLVLAPVAVPMPLLLWLLFVLMVVEPVVLVAATWLLLLFVAVMLAQPGNGGNTLSLFKFSEDGVFVFEAATLALVATPAAELVEELVASCCCW